MGLLRVGIDARGMSASGGEAHAALGLIRGLAQLQPTNVEFLVIADPFAARWLEPHLQPPFRLLPPTGSSFRRPPGRAWRRSGARANS